MTSSSASASASASASHHTAQPPPPPPLATATTTSIKRPRTPALPAAPHPSPHHADPPPTATTTDKGCRYDSSLGLLTTKFVNLLKASPDGALDLNHAAEKLHVQKRRIYDITNVLEGIGIIEKKSKNNIKWRHHVDPARSSQAELAALAHELNALKQEDKAMDEAIATYQAKLRLLATSDQCAAFAYVTHNDIKNIPELKGDTLIAIKAPPGTELEVPDPDEGMPYGERRFQIFLKSTGGPIDCLLVSQGGDDPAAAAAAAAATAAAAASATPTTATTASAVADAAAGDHGVAVVGVGDAESLHADLTNAHHHLTSPGHSVLGGGCGQDDEQDVMGCLRLSPPPVDHEFYFVLDDEQHVGESKGISDLYEEVMTAPDEAGKEHA